MILCDTGPIVAAALEDDDRHHECVESFTGLHLAGQRLLVPGAVSRWCGLGTSPPWLSCPDVVPAAGRTRSEIGYSAVGDADRLHPPALPTVLRRGLLLSQPVGAADL